MDIRFGYLYGPLGPSGWKSPYNFISGPTEVVDGLISYYEIISLLDGN